MVSRRVKEVRADSRRAIEGSVNRWDNLRLNLLDMISKITGEELHIRIPALPPAEFNQNSRVHWRRKHEAGKFYKEFVFGILMESLSWGELAPLTSARLKAVYHLKTKAVMDQDNAISRLKPAIDGLVASGLLKDDDKITIVEPVEFEKVNKDTEPWLELRLSDYAKA